jgi:hypothetical protein
MLLCAASAATALLWLRLSQAPPSWDDAHYLSSSLRVYDALTERGLPGFVRTFQSIFAIRAPLITALPIPFYLVFGRHWHAAFLVNIIAMLALSAVVFQLAWRCWSPRAALLAVAILSTMPLIYGLARWFMVEYTLTAMVAIAAWLLVESEHLERKSLVFLFGLTCGLGLLLKISFAVFITPMAFYAWMKSRNRIYSLLPAIVPCIAIALPWYSVHLKSVVSYALASGYGEFAVLQDTSSIFSLHSIALYLWRVWREGISIQYGGVGVLLGVWALASKKGRSFLVRLYRGHTLMLLWILPFVVFLFGVNKDVRYIAPVLPAMAIVLAAATDEALPGSRTGTILACLIGTVSALYMFSISFGFPVRAKEFGYALGSDHSAWPLDQILADVSAHTLLKPGDSPTLLVATDRQYFNADNINLSVVAHRLPFRVESTAHERSFSVLTDRLALASFLVYKEGGEPESPIVNPHFAEVIHIARQSGEFTEIGTGRPLPDGGIARIFQRIGGLSHLTSKAFVPPNLDIPEEFAIKFGGILELTGLSILPSGDALEVRYRWRSRGLDETDYWCFTHVVDPQGNILGQLDHRLLDGSPPLRSWLSGGSALEQLRLPIRQALLQSARLKVGIYDPVSGQRLSIAPLQGRAKVRFSVGDHSTALVTVDSLR